MRVSYYTGSISLEGECAGVSVDESLAVSSGLLNLVIVLSNDVKQHSLGGERYRERYQWKCRKMRGRSTACETQRLEAVIKEREGRSDPEL